MTIVKWLIASAIGIVAWFIFDPWFGGMELLWPITLAHELAMIATMIAFAFLPNLRRG